MLILSIEIALIRSAFKRKGKNAVVKHTTVRSPVDRLTHDVINILKSLLFLVRGNVDYHFIMDMEDDVVCGVAFDFCHFDAE